MLCLAAHLGAAAEDQTRSRVPTFPGAFFLPEDAHGGEAYDVDAEATLQVSGDSDCGGPTDLPPLQLALVLL